MTGANRTKIRVESHGNRDESPIDIAFSDAAFPHFFGTFTNRSGIPVVDTTPEESAAEVVRGLARSILCFIHDAILVFSTALDMVGWCVLLGSAARSGHDRRVPTLLLMGIFVAAIAGLPVVHTQSQMTPDTGANSVASYGSNNAYQGLREATAPGTPCCLAGSLTAAWCVASPCDAAANPQNDTIGNCESLHSPITVQHRLRLPDTRWKCDDWHHFGHSITVNQPRVDGRLSSVEKPKGCEKTALSAAKFSTPGGNPPAMNCTRPNLYTMGIVVDEHAEPKLDLSFMMVPRVATAEKSHNHTPATATIGTRTSLSHDDRAEYREPRIWALPFRQDENKGRMYIHVKGECQKVVSDLAFYGLEGPAGDNTSDYTSSLTNARNRMDDTTASFDGVGDDSTSATHASTCSSGDRRTCGCTGHLGRHRSFRNRVRGQFACNPTRTIRASSPGPTCVQLKTDEAVVNFDITERNRLDVSLESPDEHATRVVPWPGGMISAQCGPAKLPSIPPLAQPNLQEPHSREMGELLLELGPVRRHLQEPEPEPETMDHKLPHDRTMTTVTIALSHRGSNSDYECSGKLSIHGRAHVPTPHKQRVPKGARDLARNNGLEELVSAQQATRNRANEHDFAPLTNARPWVEGAQAGGGDSPFGAHASSIEVWHMSKWTRRFFDSNGARTLFYSFLRLDCEVLTAQQLTAPKTATTAVAQCSEAIQSPTSKSLTTTAAADRCIKGCHVNSAPAREEYLLKSKSTLPVAPTMLQMDMQDWCGTAIISQAALDDNQHCYQTQDESADSSDQMTQLCPLTMSPNAHCASCRDYCGCWDSGSLLCANNLEPQCLITYMCSQEPHFDQIGPIRSNTRSKITPVISLVSGLLLQLLVRSDQSVHTRSMLAIAPLFFLPVAHGDEPSHERIALKDNQKLTINRKLFKSLVRPLPIGSPSLYLHTRPCHPCKFTAGAQPNTVLARAWRCVHLRGVRTRATLIWHRFSLSDRGTTVCKCALSPPAAMQYMCGAPFAADAMCCLACDTVCDTRSGPIGRECTPSCLCHTCAAYKWSAMFN